MRSSLTRSDSTDIITKLLGNNHESTCVHVKKPVHWWVATCSTAAFIENLGRSIREVPRKLSNCDNETVRAKTSRPSETPRSTRQLSVARVVVTTGP